MRKIAAVCLCLILMALNAVPAFAAADVAMTLKADEQTLKPGDKVTICLDVQAEHACNSFGVMMVYDEKIFEVVEGSCEVSGALLADFDPTRGFVAMYLVASKPQGEIGEVTLQVRPDAPVGEATFTGKPSVKEGSTSLECSINTVTFQIAGDATQQTQQQQTEQTSSHNTEQTQPITEATTKQDPTQSDETSKTETMQSGPSQSGGQTNNPPQQKKDTTLLVAVIAVVVVAAVAVGGYLVLKKKQQ